MQYNLEERTAEFAVKVIQFVKTLSITPVNSRIIPQLVASSGSIAANYCEAIEGESKRDFIHKILIAKKEIKETKLWLHLLLNAELNKEVLIKPLQREAQELLLIFAKIVITSRTSKTKLEN